MGGIRMPDVNDSKNKLKRKLKFKHFKKGKNRHYFGHIVFYFRLILFPSDTVSGTVQLDFMVDIFMF